MSKITYSLSFSFKKYLEVIHSPFCYCHVTYSTSVIASLRCNLQLWPRGKVECALDVHFRIAQEVGHLGTLVWMCRTYYSFKLFFTFFIAGETQSYMYEWVECYINLTVDTFFTTSACIMWSAYFIIHNAFSC